MATAAFVGQTVLFYEAVDKTYKASNPTHHEPALPAIVTVVTTPSNVNVTVFDSLGRVRGETSVKYQQIGDPITLLKSHYCTPTS